MAPRRPCAADLPIYKLDAFTDRLFRGNPAAVMPLEKWLPAGTMQRIAAENNLSETAFIVPAPSRGTGDKSPRFAIRWFTPAIEVALCGHATLASGWVVLTHIVPKAKGVTFNSKSGPLYVSRCVNRGAGMLELDFPALPPQPASAALQRRVAKALGTTVEELWRSDRLMAVLPNARAVHRAAPDFAALAALPGKGLIITARAGATDKPADFVSRYFAPYAGVNEDPVTGSAHCTLMPYWAERLGRQRLHARQVSARVGDLFCEMRGDRVAMAGKVALYLQGTVHVAA